MLQREREGEPGEAGGWPSGPPAQPFGRSSQSQRRPDAAGVPAGQQCGRGLRTPQPPWAAQEGRQPRCPGLPDGTPSTRGSCSPAPHVRAPAPGSTALGPLASSPFAIRCTRLHLLRGSCSCPPTAVNVPLTPDPGCAASIAWLPSSVSELEIVPASHSEVALMKLRGAHA